MNKIKALTLNSLVCWLVLFAPNSAFSFVNDLFSCSDQVTELKDSQIDLLFIQAVGKFEQLRVAGGTIGMSTNSMRDAAEREKYIQDNLALLCTLYGAGYYAADLVLDKYLGNNPDFSSFSTEKREAIQNIWEELFLLDRFCGGAIAIDLPKIAEFYLGGDLESVLFAKRAAIESNQDQLATAFARAAQSIERNLRYLSGKPK